MTRLLEPVFCAHLWLDGDDGAEEAAENVRVQLEELLERLLWAGQIRAFELERQVPRP